MWEFRWPLNVVCRQEVFSECGTIQYPETSLLYNAWGFLCILDRCTLDFLSCLLFSQLVILSCRSHERPWSENLSYPNASFCLTFSPPSLSFCSSFLQTVCVLGYCILPLVISLIVCRLLVFAGTKSLWLFIFRLAIVAFGLIYSSFASFVFLTPTQPPNRVGLTLYPVCLFYFFMSWLVISVPNQ